MVKLTAEQNKRIAVWQKNMWLKHNVKLQESGYPYGGAAGGFLTYMFTPTSIGTVIKVQCNFTNEIIDLTDYDMF